MSPVTPLTPALRAVEQRQLLELIRRLNARLAVAEKYKRFNTVAYLSRAIASLEKAAHCYENGG